MSTTGKLRAVIYKRQSMDRNNDAQAVARQDTQAREMVSRSGYHLVDVITDNDVSATSSRKRPGYSKLLGMVTSGQLDVIVTPAVDRLMRKLTDLEHLIVLAEQHNVLIQSLAGELDLSTPAGRLNARILASVARGEVETKAARQVARNKQAAEQGRPIRGGMRTIGYVDRSLSELHPTEAPLIRLGYEHLLAGGSARGIAKVWNQAGLRTARNGEFVSGTVRMVLTNPRYAGISVYRSNRKNAIEMGEGNWPALVSRDIYEAACAILKDPARKTSPGGQVRKYLMSGLAICDDCGSVMRSAHVSGKLIYRCAKLNRSRRVDEVDSFVREVVAAQLRRSDVQLPGASNADASLLADEASALRSKLERMPALWLDGLLTEAQMVKGTADCKARLEAIGASQAAAAGSLALAPLLAAADPGQAFLEASLEVQRTIVGLLVTVTLKGLGRGSWRQSFDPSSIQLDWR